MNVIASGRILVDGKVYFVTIAADTNELLRSLGKKAARNKRDISRAMYGAILAEATLIPGATQPW